MAIDLDKIIRTSPECVGGGRLSPVSPLKHFPDTESASSGQDSPWLMPLDGKWKFAYYNKPEEVPDNFSSPDLNDSTWNDITVPGCWDMQGYDRPHYTNISMPFPELPPDIPENNPTGVYRLDIDIPAGWNQGRVILHFDGVENCFVAFINGITLGFNKDSRSATEFDVSQHLRPGKNLLTVIVFKWSDAAFVEDQDQW